MPKTTVRRYYRIDRRQIHFLKFILEGYDGVAVLRTIDPQKGLVVLQIGPGCQSIVDMIIYDLQRHIRIEPVELRDQ
jgi:hypothetical protein